MPPVPTGVVACFERAVPIPAGPLSRGQVLQLLAAYERTDAAKTACGRRLIAFYRDVAAELGR